MPQREKPLVLCVEDEEDTRELLRVQLEKDFELLFAPDGREGVRLAIFHRPELVVMDLMMPGLDGVEASGMIKSIQALKGRPLVVLTAASPELQAKALEAGCDLVIEKPAHDLPARLRALLERRTTAESPAGS